jgi:hypothetical protein
MWTKITSREQLAALQVNTIVVKYPIFGEAQETYDGATQENVSPRIVSIM